jgi:hypothetical protein
MYRLLCTPSGLRTSPLAIGRSALLALGFAGAFRRSDLRALEVADLTEAPNGLRVSIRRSKSDPEGQGSGIAIPRGCRLRPVEAVQACIARVIQLAAKVGLNPADFAGHRFVTSAVEADTPLMKIAKQSHRSIAMLQVYSRPRPRGGGVLVCVVGQSRARSGLLADRAVNRGRCPGGRPLVFCRSSACRAGARCGWAP